MGNIVSLWCFELPENQYALNPTKYMEFLKYVDEWPLNQTLHGGKWLAVF